MRDVVAGRQTVEQRFTSLVRHDATFDPRRRGHQNGGARDGEIRYVAHDEPERAGTHLRVDRRGKTDT